MTHIQRQIAADIDRLESGLVQMGAKVPQAQQGPRVPFAKRSEGQARRNARRNVIARKREWIGG